MKISVKYTVSQRYTSENFDILEDLGISDEDWELMSEDDKHETLMDAMNEQPYWVVDRIYEIE